MERLVIRIGVPYLVDCKLENIISKAKSHLTVSCTSASVAALTIMSYCGVCPAPHRSVALVYSSDPGK